MDGVEEEPTALRKSSTATAEANNSSLSPSTATEPSSSNSSEPQQHHMTDGTVVGSSMQSEAKSASIDTAQTHKEQEFALVPPPQQLQSADKGKGKMVEQEGSQSAISPFQEDPVDAPNAGDTAHAPPTARLATTTSGAELGDDTADVTTKMERVSLEDRLGPSSDETARQHQPGLSEPTVPPPVPDKPEEEWPLKLIAWPPLPPPPSNAHGQIESMGPSVKIVCQNHNGPCSLIALCNILILRGEISISPPSRTSVSYSYLSNLVANHLLTSTAPAASDASPPMSLEAVLEILPSTRYGLNLNPRFGHIDGFRETSKGSGELALFATSKVPLLHGWVVDPQDAETWDVVVEKAGDYDAAVEKIVAGDEISGGEVNEAEQDETAMLDAVERRSRWTPEQERAVNEAHIIRRFLSSSSTQLTYHGLFLLANQLAPSSLSAIFRNSHLSVLFRRPATPTPSNTPQLGTEGPALFTLVTDSSFVHEPDVVWESLEDVEGALSDFYDDALRRTSVRGGEYVRASDRDEERQMTCVRRDEEARMRRLRREEAEQLDVEALARQSERLADGGDTDLALAQRIQEAEYDRAWQADRERQQRQAYETQGTGPQQNAGAHVPPPRRESGQTSAKPGQDHPLGKKSKTKAKDKDKCLVM